MTASQEILTRAARPAPAGIKLTGWALVLAPLLILIGEVLHPQRSAVPAQQLAIVAQHPGAWYASHLLLFAGIVLTLPAVAGLVFLLGGRTRRLAAVGAGLAIAGIACFAGLLTIGFVVWQMASQDADRSQMAALFSRLFHAPGFIVPFQAVPLTFAAGMVILAIALDRAAVTPRWVALSLGAGDRAVPGGDRARCRLRHRCQRRPGGRHGAHREAHPHRRGVSPRWRPCVRPAADRPGHVGIETQPAAA